MRSLRAICLYAISLLALACAGNVDDSSLPILSVDKSDIDLADTREVVFIVKYNGEDVTSSSEIFDAATGQPLGSSVFAPSKEGSYSFYASYSGKSSNTVEVNVTDSAEKTGPVVNTRFDRHVAVFEFTGAWCINCPAGYTAMETAFQSPSLKKYAGNIHLMAFHSNVEGTDTLALSATQDVFNLCKELAPTDPVKVSLAFPSYAVDLRTANLLTTDGLPTFSPAIRSSFEDYPAHCGVAVSSRLDESGRNAEVTVKLTSEYDTEYRVVVLVVQDKIEGWQKTTLYPEGKSDYLHRHVVRRVVTSYRTTFTGERMADEAVIPAGKECVKSWNVELDSRWVLDNTEIYALALDERGRVNNMNVCSIKGGDSGYDLL